MATPYTDAALKTEIQTDPAALGYAPQVAAGNDGAVAGLLNAPTNTNIFRNDIGVREVIDAIVAADFAALTQLQVSKLLLFFTGTAVLDATNSNTRTIFLGIFTGMTGTVSALTALAQRHGTRAEVLFGIGTVLSPTDVSRALRGQS